jgi:hypothetical protein
VFLSRTIIHLPFALSLSKACIEVDAGAHRSCPEPMPSFGRNGDSVRRYASVSSGIRVSIPGCFLQRGRIFFNSPAAFGDRSIDERRRL